MLFRSRTHGSLRLLPLLCHDHNDISSADAEDAKAESDYQAFLNVSTVAQTAMETSVTNLEAT